MNYRGAREEHEVWMPWNKMYWDIHDQLYWTPEYIGLKSIKKENWVVSGDTVCIPRSLVHANGLLYSRARKYDDLYAYLQGREDILNHVFDLTFAIAPDELLRRAFAAPLRLDARGSFRSLGREVWKRYGWGRQENVAQHDGWFLSDDTVLGVELKLRATSSVQQIAKYIALMIWEEQVSGTKPKLGLLYIVPEDRVPKWWVTCGLDRPRLEADFHDRALALLQPGRLKTLVAREHDHFNRICQRVVLGVISWTELKQTLEDFMQDLDESHAGDQTLIRLMGGFLAQLRMHSGTGLTGALPA